MQVSTRKLSKAEWARQDRAAAVENLRILEERSQFLNFRSDRARVAWYAKQFEAAGETSERAALCARACLQLWRESL